MIKLTITSECNAKCRTCPVHKTPDQHMDVDEFKFMWNKLAMFPIPKVFINNTGDMYNHPDRMEIFKYIEENKNGKFVIMTTNAEKMDYVPKFEQLVISFNGGNKETYEYTTGLPFEKTVENIRKHYDELKKIPILEMHCLIWKGNEGCEDDFKELWKDFPGRLRLSYKYDNQMEEDHTLDKFKKDKRVPCDYLQMLSVMPNGQIVSCAHDFHCKTNFGNLIYDDIHDIIKNKYRIRAIQEHHNGVYNGICKNCNYNTGISGRIVYIK